MSGGESLLGLGVALGAAGCYEVSYAVQALEARAVPGRAGPRASLLLDLARRPRWAAAILLAVAGFGLQIGALRLAPLTLVQPAIASGLLLLFYLGARVLNEPVGQRDIAAALAIVGGVAGIAAAAPERTDSVSRPLALGMLMGGLVLIALAPYLWRSGRGALLIASAGGADIAAVFAAKLVSNALGQGRLLAAVGLAAGAGATVLVGLTSESAALQRLPATRVAPLVLVLQTAAPVLLAPLLLGEDWGATALGGAVIAVSLALVAAGGVTLASSGPVGELLAPVDAVEHE